MNPYIVIAALLISGISAFCLGRLYSIPKRHPCADLHEFIAVGAQPDHEKITTIVLFKCQRCKLFATGFFAGQWTLEHFIQDAIQNYLDGMAR